MTKMQHTPGPWRYSRCQCGHHSCNQYLMDNQGGVGFSLEDARAIAEVPAMLAALRKLVVSHAALCTSPDWDAQDEADQAEARAILARIDGEG